jgi:multicomponent Na+:H+ antiporter subunit B
VQEHAVAQTGAINLVSAIYLDYRLFDTLAEAVVLIVAVLGIFVVMRNKE